MAKPKHGESQAEANRRERRENLRSLLSEQGHLQHVHEMVEKISSLGEEMDASEVNRLKIAIDTKLKLLNKILPDDKEAQDLNLQVTELTHEEWLKNLND